MKEKEKKENIYEILVGSAMMHFSFTKANAQTKTHLQRNDSKTKHAAGTQEHRIDRGGKKE